MEVPEECIEFPETRDTPAWIGSRSLTAAALQHQRKKINNNKKKNNVFMLLLFFLFFFFLWSFLAGRLKGRGLFPFTQHSPLFFYQRALVVVGRRSGGLFCIRFLRRELAFLLFYLKGGGRRMGELEEVRNPPPPCVLLQVFEVPPCRSRPLLPLRRLPWPPLRRLRPPLPRCHRYVCH